jgi:lipoprotein-releasing system permease protein
MRVVTAEGVEDVVRVAGIFTLGNMGVDKSWVLTSLRHAQSLFALAGGVTGLEVKVADVFEAERMAAETQRRTGLAAESWMSVNAELLVGLSAQSSSKTMIQFFVVVAVALGIASVLIVSVVQKSREIGILRAFGTPARRILAIFLTEGAVLGLVGSFFGSALGTLLARFFETVARNPDGGPKFPVVLDLPLYLSASLLATGVGLAAAVAPALRASRMDPATAIGNG